MSISRETIIEKAKAAGMNPRVVLDRVDLGWPLKDALMPFEAFAKEPQGRGRPSEDVELRPIVKKPRPEPQDLICERCGKTSGMAGESALIGWCKSCYRKWCGIA